MLSVRFERALPSRSCLVGHRSVAPRAPREAQPRARLPRPRPPSAQGSRAVTATALICTLCSASSLASTGSPSAGEAKSQPPAAACCGVLRTEPSSYLPLPKGALSETWCRSSHVTDPDRPPQHLRLASRGESIPSEHLLAFGPFALSSLLWSKQRTSAAAFGPCVLSSRLPLRKRRLR